MNKKDVFKGIIRSFQKKSLAAVKKRSLALPLNSGKVITVSGVRRSGKTCLLLDAVSRLLAQGVELTSVVYVNFEDERLETDKKDLDLILQAYQELYPDAELAKTYFFFPLRKYSASVIKREACEKKVYVVDTGLAGAVSFNIAEDRGKLLENAVFMQFHALGAEIFFYKDKKECDFIRLVPGGKPAACQVCYDLSAEGAKKREFDGLIEACKSLGLKSGTVITMSDEFEEEIAGVEIQVVPFYKWALM